MSQVPQSTAKRAVIALVRLVAALIVVGCLVIVAARAFKIEAGPLAFLVPLTPYFALAAVVALILALVTRFWVVAVAALVPLVVIGYWWLPPFTNSPPTDSPTVLTVATANLKFGLGDACTVVDMARGHNVQLLALEEVTEQAAADLRACGLDDLFPHSFVWPGRWASGSAMWSKYPLTETTRITGTEFANLKARVQLPSGPMTWATVHPVAPNPVRHPAWDIDTAALTRSLTAITGPALITGDFNATRDQPFVLDLESAGFTDAATAAGSGLIRTFPVGSPTLVPIVGIDHVMTRDTAMLPVATETHQIPGSDHRALIARFAAK